MTQVKIFTTPSSITIYDASNNKLMVKKNADGLEFHSSIDNAKTSNRIIALQQEIKKHLLNPANTKDNFQKRFRRLADKLNSVKTHSFITLKNALA